jgi:hypothetical protein
VKEFMNLIAADAILFILLINVFVVVDIEFKFIKFVVTVALTPLVVLFNIKLLVVVEILKLLVVVPDPPPVAESTNTTSPFISTVRALPLAVVVDEEAVRFVNLRPEVDAVADLTSNVFWGFIVPIPNNLVVSICVVLVPLYCRFRAALAFVFIAETSDPEKFVIPMAPATNVPAVLDTYNSR